MRDLQAAIVPAYAEAIPLTDGWGRDFIVQSSANEYRLWSVGKDGAIERSMNGGATTGYDADIVFANGDFVQWPERWQSDLGEAGMVPGASPEPASGAKVETSPRPAPRPARTSMPRIDRSIRRTSEHLARQLPVVPVHEAHLYTGRTVDVYGHDGSYLKGTLIGATAEGIVLDRGVGGTIMNYTVDKAEIRKLQVHPK
jgi:hypothetical protein